MEKYRYIRKTVTWNHHRYEVRGKTEQEACDKLADLITTLKQGDLALAGSNLTVDQWFAQWRDTYKAPSGLTPKSFGLYDEKYRGYIGPAVGHLKLTEVRDLHLQTILNTQAGRSYSHVSKLRMVMQELFRQARRSRILLYDPAEGLQLPESVKGTHRPITNQERRHILALAQTHPSGLWVLTILYTGLRPGETAALLWKDIDFARNEIHVYKAVESGTRAIKAPKTPAGVRDIPMRPELRDRLLAARGAPESPVFPSARGGVRSANSLRRLWNAFARDLDLRMGAKVRDGEVVQHAIAPDLTPYCLRHTFCTDLQRAGGQGAHGPRQHLRDGQHLYPPGPEGPPLQHGEADPPGPAGRRQAVGGRWHCRERQTCRRRSRRRNEGGVRERSEEKTTPEPVRARGWERWGTLLGTREITSQSGRRSTRVYHHCRWLQS